MKKVKVALPDRGYEIWIGKNACKRVGAWQGLKDATQTFILADARLKAHTRILRNALVDAGFHPEVFEVEATEGFKDLKRLYPFYGRLLACGADRKSVLFAVGGGVIGDAAGFLASTYLRGIRWVGVATTLLAQVDSAIGGKTAVNHDKGKNLIGSFHQPSLVICDTAFLGTLPMRDRISGLGEMIKYGLIYDPRLFKQLEKDWRKTSDLEAGAVESAVARCVRWKAQAVVRDEFDALGIREVLNFGHTLAHALEAATGYGYFRHGEAVILGMRAAARISVIRGHLSQREGARIDALLAELPLPALPGKVTLRELLRHMRYDKKSEAGKVRFVLLKRIGRTVSDREVRDEEVLEALSFLK